MSSYVSSELPIYQIGILYMQLRGLRPTVNIRAAPSSEPLVKRLGGVRQDVHAL